MTTNLDHEKRGQSALRKRGGERLLEQFPDAESGGDFWLAVGEMEDAAPAASTPAPRDRPSRRKSETAAAAGRPRGSESKRRLREFLRLLAEGETTTRAAKLARVSPDRIVALFWDDAQFRAAVVALIDQRQQAA